MSPRLLYLMRVARCDAGWRMGTRNLNDWLAADKAMGGSPGRTTRGGVFA